jgi:hypothetical protein
VAFAYSLSLSDKQLTDLLEAHEASFQYAILECVAAIQFVTVARPPDDFHFDANFQPQYWERGHAFGEEMELRWRRRRSEFAVLLISESPLTQSAGIPLSDMTELSRVESEEPLQIALWGEWQDPDEETELKPLESQGRQWWYEERIPQFLGYPHPARADYLAIEVACYRESSQSAQDDFPGDYIYRFVRLVPFNLTDESQEEEAE